VPAPKQISPADYESWRATRLGAITESLERRVILELMGPVQDADVLDAGCGDGALACAMASGGASVTGLDADPVMLAAARARAAMTGARVTFLPGRIEQLPLADARFDVVVAVTVLCFAADAATAVREMARVLRPRGRLVLGELGRWSTWAATRRLKGWLGASTWKAARFRSAGALRALLEEAGLSVKDLRGAVFYPPIGLCARHLAPLDPWMGRHTTIGAAFIALNVITD
jgi:2-polyprenyl-3-methyl-5-hydroxy-6-metoxy-1,4-benzoquinol methylase